MQAIWIIIISIVFGNQAQQAFASELYPICSLESRDRGCEEYRNPDNSKRFFRVNGTELTIDWNIRQLMLECLTEMETLDVAALPHYSKRQVFDEVYIQNCTLGNATVAGILRALNASVESKLALERVRGPLRAAHVAGVHVHKLSLETYVTFLTRLEEDFFTAFQNDSTLNNLITNGFQYERPPSGLQKWTSTNAMLERLPGGAMLTLQELYLVEPRLRDASALTEATQLRALEMWAPASGPLPRLDALRTLRLRGWAGLGPRALQCPALEALSVQAAPLAPAAGWLAGCARLRKLELWHTPLPELPPDLLRHNRELRELTIRGVGLTSQQLPVDFLATNVELTSLDLSHNRLTSVPSPSFWRRLEKLSELDLSWNRLAAPAEWFPALPALRTLRLDHNPLGDACPDTGTDVVRAAQSSWLQQLTSLRTLSLRNTSAVRLCLDWLLFMPHLATLDLADNDVAELSYQDLHPVRNQESVIVLQGNNVSGVRYSERDYERAGADAGRPQTKVMLTSKLRCDCYLYWFAAALQRFRTHVRANSLVCEGGAALRTAALDSLTCAARCGPGCACRVVPARAAIEAACSALHPNVTAYPDYQMVTNLSLAGLGLQSPPAAGSLPAALRELDLRNNSLGGAGGLLRTLRLRLAGNPLDCRCGKRAFVDDIIHYKANVIDFDSLVCLDGSPVQQAACGVSAGGAALLALLAALAAAAGLAAAALAHPRPRAQLKIILRVLGVRVPGEPRGTWRYDAFVSFAEADAAWVVRQLVPVLERGPKPRRLCLHFRDWEVGELILQQIARSVSESRRTLLVVSDAFARSQWARAELDAALAATARDARPPPLAVLLAAPTHDALQSAPSLSQYLSAATYLRADDAHFARKLRAAVPAAAGTT